MPNPYTSVTITGYNANPPPDDGSNNADNEITWAKHKNKLGDPLKDAVESINTNVFSAFDLIFLNAVVDQSDNYTVQTSDQGALINVTGTNTITLPPAATAEQGFAVSVRNAGSGTVTVDGDGGETINGETTIDLDADESLILVSDGSNWIGPHVRAPQLPQSPTVQTFTSDGTWNKPSGVQVVVVEVVGGGGAGGGAQATGASEASFGTGGNGGAYARKVIDVSSISSATVTVGSGGTGNTTGSNGGSQSQWDDGTNTITAPGGDGGFSLAPATGPNILNAPGAQSTSTGGDVNTAEYASSFAFTNGSNIVVASPGADSIFGGGGVASGANDFSGDFPGGNASAPGAGGGGAYSADNSQSENGGDGGDGVVIVTEYYQLS